MTCRVSENSLRGSPLGLKEPKALWSNNDGDRSVQICEGGGNESQGWRILPPPPFITGGIMDKIETCARGLSPASSQDRMIPLS